jgi:hypothetical protein
MTKRHPWLLVGPWYRWQRPGDPGAGRLSAPVLEKFASADFVNEFLGEPQRSLVYGAEDRVAGSATRKVFLPSHGRFYLVVCELHCDVAGFPSTSREQVCEAGFVVRRRTYRVGAQVRREVAKLLRVLSASETEAKDLGALARKLAPAAPGTEIDQVSFPAQAKAAARAEAARSGLQGLEAAGRIRQVLEGWVPSEFQGVGAWAEVGAEPQDLAGEAVFPLYPLIPDPKVKDHSARGRSLWFGVLPATSSDLDANASPRFDDRSLYEVRCFVRRHRPECPRRPGRNDCKGELVWSRPTDPYRLAPHFDLAGTSNRPVTVQLPDLVDLKAQAEALAPGRGVGVRMVSPPRSFLSFGVSSAGAPQGARVGGAAICSFSIPLITLVATFVLRLFLPVVVFLFQLWFLLKLRFCIPPTFAMDAGLVADLDLALAGGVGIDAALEARVDAALSANLGAHVAAGLKADLGAAERARTALHLCADFRAGAPPELAAEFEDPPPGTGGLAAELPPVTAGLRYHDRVEAAP